MNNNQLNGLFKDFVQSKSQWIAKSDKKIRLVNKSLNASQSFNVTKLFSPLFTLRLNKLVHWTHV